MDSFFWWSGVVAWATLGLIGLSLAIDQIIEWTVPALWTKREFFAFVVDRLKSKNK